VKSEIKKKEKIMWQIVKQLFLKFRRITLISVGVVILLILLANAWFIIGPGSIGVKYNVLTGNTAIYTSGFYFKLPFIIRITKFDGKVQKVTYDEEAFSKDMQHLQFKVSLNYHLDTKSVNKLFAQIGNDYETIVINPAVLNEIKTSAAKYNVENIIENRDAIKKTIEDSLSVILSSSNVIVDAVNIENIKFDPKFQKAVEDRQIQVQQYRPEGQQQ